LTAVIDIHIWLRLVAVFHPGQSVGGLLGRKHLSGIFLDVAKPLPKLEGPLDAIRLQIRPKIWGLLTAKSLFQGLEMLSVTCRSWDINCDWSFLVANWAVQSFAECLANFSWCKMREGERDPILLCQTY
jgi:hypothetical protein